MQDLLYNSSSIYFWLLVIHLVYDWHWQGEFVGVFKSKLQIVLIIHCATWSLLMLIPFIWFGYTEHNKYILTYLFATHYIIDFWKCRILKQELRLTNRYLFLDQFLHFVSIVLLFIWMLK